jgi:hypothetical protein
LAFAYRVSNWDTNQPVATKKANVDFISCHHNIDLQLEGSVGISEAKVHGSFRSLETSIRYYL